MFDRLFCKKTFASYSNKIILIISFKIHTHAFNVLCGLTKYFLHFNCKYMYAYVYVNPHQKMNFILDKKYFLHAKGLLRLNKNLQISTTIVSEWKYIHKTLWKLFMNNIFWISINILPLKQELRNVETEKAFHSCSIHYKREWQSNHVVFFILSSCFIECTCLVSQMWTFMM